MRKLGRYYLKPEEQSYYKIHPYLMNDGRHVGKVGETWVSWSIDGKTQPENFPFDVLTNESEFYQKGQRLEVRSAITNVSFASSNEVGSSRTVTEEGFITKLDSLDYFVILDSRQLVNGYVDMYELTKEDVLKLGLGKRKQMACNKFWKKVEDGIK